MRTLYDIISDELKDKYFRWKSNLHVITYLSKEDFITTFDEDVAWLVFSMWILVRINHILPSKYVEDFKIQIKKE